MSDWRDIHADQNLRLAQKMLEQQGEINALRTERDALKDRVEELEAKLILRAMDAFEVPGSES